MTKKIGIIGSDGFSYEGWHEPDPPPPVRIGLNKWASELVSTKGSVALYRVVIEQVFPSGRRELISDKPKYQETVKTPAGRVGTGEWGDGGVESFQYLLPDGRRFKEVLQATIVDHDYFIALADETGKIVPESLWTWEEWRSVGGGR